MPAIWKELPPGSLSFSEEAALPDVAVLKCSFQQRVRWVISATAPPLVSPSGLGDELCRNLFCVCSRLCLPPAFVMLLCCPVAARTGQGWFFRHFHMRLMVAFLILELRSIENTSRLGFGGVFFNNYYYFCIKGNVTISGVRETEGFGVLFFINGVLKNITLLELLLSLHKIWRRK